VEDAGNYITKLPKSQHSAPEWQAAMKCLILVAEKNGPTMMARIGVMRALNRHIGAFSIPTGKTRIGDGESWQGIDDSPRRYEEAGRARVLALLHPGAPKHVESDRISRCRRL